MNVHKSKDYKSYVGIFILIMGFSIISNALINLYIMAIDNSNKALVINVQDNDKSELSNKLADEILDKNKANIVYNEQEGIESVSKGNADLFVIINTDFEKKIKEGSFNKVMTVYTSFNPKQSKMLLETVSKEVLKMWTNVKIEKDNKNLNINIDWKQLDNKKQNSITLRNVTIVSDNGGNIDEIKSDKADIKEDRNHIKVKINIIILFLSVNVLLYMFSKRIMGHKLKGLKKRVELFSVGGKTFYRNSLLSFLIVVAIESIAIYSVIFAIYGASIGFIIVLFFKFIIYEIAVFIANGIMMKISKSMAVYNVLNTSFMIACIMIILVWVFI